MPPFEQQFPLRNLDSSAHGLNLNLLALNDFPSASKKSSVSEAYSKLDLDNAIDLLKNPAKFDDLYKTERKYIDANGDGRIDKTEIISTLDDPSASSRTKRLANAMLAGYDRLSQLNQESEISELIPAGLKEFIQGHDSNSKAGIGEEQIRALRMSGDPSFRSSEENSKAWKYFGIAAAGVAAVFLVRRAPEIFVRSLCDGSSIMSKMKSFGSLALYGTLPTALASGTVAYGVSRASDLFQHKREQSKANDMLIELSRLRSNY